MRSFFDILLIVAVVFEVDDVPAVRVGSSCVSVGIASSAYSAGCSYVGVLVVAGIVGIVGIVVVAVVSRRRSGRGFRLIVVLLLSRFRLGLGSGSCAKAAPLITSAAPNISSNWKSGAVLARRFGIVPSI